MFAYLKLNDSVLIYVNVPGGDRVLSQLAGDKHHGGLILLPGHTYISKGLSGVTFGVLDRSALIFT